MRKFSKVSKNVYSGSVGFFFIVKNLIRDQRNYKIGEQKSMNQDRQDAIS